MSEEDKTCQTTSICESFHQDDVNRKAYKQHNIHQIAKFVIRKTIFQRMSWLEIALDFQAEGSYHSKTNVKVDIQAECFSLKTKESVKVRMLETFVRKRHIYINIRSDVNARRSERIIKLRTFGFRS